MSTPTSTTPERDVFAGEVVEGDVIMTEHGPRPVHSVVRLGAMAHIYYRTPRGTDSIVRPLTSSIAIRAAVVS
jgi:hypothetical protein